MVVAQSFCLTKYNHTWMNKKVLKLIMTNSNTQQAMLETNILTASAIHEQDVGWVTR